MLCTPLVTPSLKSVEEANRVADLIEFRLDHLPHEEVERLRAASTIPVVFTGGERLELKPDYLDLPFDRFRKVSGVKQISSYHNFDETPHDLSQFVHPDADIVKVCTMARTTSDALRMLAFVREQTRPTIGICMGEKGAITRILAPVFGAPWTYAPLTEDQQTAPGQLLLSTLVSRYRYRSLSTKTALYGLIGSPVTQSPSDRTHNAVFGAFSIDGVYVKMEVAPEELETFLSLAHKVGFQGLSVTMPHKRSFGKEPINTLSRTQSGWKGTNTDGPGALDALEERGKVKGKRLVILGRGGTAQAIAAEARKRGAKVVLWNRDSPPFSEIAAAGYDVLVNATPTMPIPPDALLPERLAFEVRHGYTPFLEAAQAKGCPTIDGSTLFVKQAARQFSHWFPVLHSKSSDTQICRDGASGGSAEIEADC